MRGDVRRLQRLVQAVYGRSLPADAPNTLVPQTSIALRKLSFVKSGLYREQLWHERWGLNLTLLYELLSAPDNSGIMSAITRISDMGALRAQYLRDFAIACKQRGVV